MTIINESTFEKAKKKIQESEHPIIFTNHDDEFNRKILEKLKIDILLINLEDRKDFSKQRDSGFNQVLAKIAQKKDTQIGINIDELIESKNKSRILARIKQNIILCNKNKLQMQFIAEKYKRNIYELKALGSTLGMPTWMTKKITITNS